MKDSRVPIAFAWLVLQGLIRCPSAADGDSNFCASDVEVNTYIESAEGIEVNLLQTDLILNRREHPEQTTQIQTDGIINEAKRNEVLAARQSKTKRHGLVAAEAKIGATAKVTDARAAELVTGGVEIITGAPYPPSPPAVEKIVLAPMATVNVSVTSAPEVPQLSPGEQKGLDWLNGAKSAWKYIALAVFLMACGIAFCCCVVLSGGSERYIERDEEVPRIAYAVPTTTSAPLPVEHVTYAEPTTISTTPPASMSNVFQTHNDASRSTPMSGQIVETAPARSSYVQAVPTSTPMSGQMLQTAPRASSWSPPIYTVPTSTPMSGQIDQTVTMPRANSYSSANSMVVGTGRISPRSGVLPSSIVQAQGSIVNMGLGIK